MNIQFGNEGGNNYVLITETKGNDMRTVLIGEVDGKCTVIVCQKIDYRIRQQKSFEVETAKTLGEIVDEFFTFGFDKLA